MNNHALPSLSLVIPRYLATNVCGSGDVKGWVTLAKDPNSGVASDDVQATEQCCTSIDRQQGRTRSPPTSSNSCIFPEPSLLPTITPLQIDALADQPPTRPQPPPPQPRWCGDLASLVYRGTQTSLASVAASLRRRPTTPFPRKEIRRIEVEPILPTNFRAMIPTVTATGRWHLLSSASARHGVACTADRPAAEVSEPKVDDAALFGCLGDSSVFVDLPMMFRLASSRWARLVYSSGLESSQRVEAPCSEALRRRRISFRHRSGSIGMGVARGHRSVVGIRTNRQGIEGHCGHPNRLCLRSHRHQ